MRQALTTPVNAKFERRRNSDDDCCENWAQGESEQAAEALNQQPKE
jgi:hypothetical protein